MGASLQTSSCKKFTILSMEIQESFFVGADPLGRSYLVTCEPLLRILETPFLGLGCSSQGVADDDDGDMDKFT